MGEAPVYPSAPPSHAVEAPPESWPLPPPPPPKPGRWTLGRERWAAIIAVCGAWFGGIGALLPWANYADGTHLTGLDQGNGWIALGFAFAAAALAGATFFGAGRIGVRIALLASSLAILGVFFFNRFRVHQADGESKVGPVLMGRGLQLVGVAGFIVLAAALMTAPWQGLLRQSG